MLVVYVAQQPSLKYQMNLVTRRGHRGGCRGCIHPTRPKEVLTRHLISLKLIAKNIFVLRVAKSLEIFSRTFFSMRYDQWHEEVW